MYTKAKELAKFKNTKPSLTDQSQAADTDLNVILKKYGITGRAPGGKQPIPPGDYTDAPEDLRGHIELAKRVQKMQQSLPENLRGLTLEQLARLDNKQLALYDAMIEKGKVKPNDNAAPNTPADTAGPDTKKTT